MTWKLLDIGVFGSAHLNSIEQPKMVMAEFGLNVHVHDKLLGISILWHPIRLTCCLWYAESWTIHWLRVWAEHERKKTRLTHERSKWQHEYERVIMIRNICCCVRWKQTHDSISINVVRTWSSFVHRTLNVLIHENFPAVQFDSSALCLRCCALHTFRLHSIHKISLLS